MDKYQGDPAIQIIDDGATLIFINGNPIMDQGLENQAQISLFTEPGWAGNYLFSEEEQKIGSDFEEMASGPITLSNLSLIEKSAENALVSDLFDNVRAIATNPNSWRTDVLINIEPPGLDSSSILLTQNGTNWINQAAVPAHETAAKHEPRDEAPCIPTSFLELSGTDEPIVGSVYSASGGCEPLTFSISCGTIDSVTGEVTDLTGCCGSGSVTVTDASGEALQVVVRFPIGQWVDNDDWTPSSCGWDKDEFLGGSISKIACETIIGGTKTLNQYVYSFNGLNPNLSCILCAPDTCLLADYIPCKEGSTDKGGVAYGGFWTESWECP